MGNYKTVLKTALDEITIKKSRFICHVSPVNSEEQAQQFIEQIKKQHRNATHNVPVYVIGEKFDIQRYSDDGEPSGTAGVPILDMLKKERITNVAMVVTRYFGGIKLGTGGLVRAYTQSAQIGLDAAQIVSKCEHERLHITVSYNFQGSVEHFLNNHPEFITSDIKYTDVVMFEVFVTNDKQMAFCDKIMKITMGKAKIQNIGTQFLTICDGNVIYSDRRKV